MKIAIDISQTAHDNTGVSRYMKNLTNSICSNPNNYHFAFFFSSLRKHIDPQLKMKIISSGHKLIIQPIPPTILSLLWNKLHILQAERLMGKHDVILTSDWIEPPSKKIKMTIVHDLVFKKYPETVHPSILQTLDQRLKWVSKESNLIIVDSKTTKNDLLHYYDINSNRIEVIYPFVNTSNIKPSSFTTIKQNYKISTPYILTVGKTEPRKNLHRLIQAFNSIRKSHKYTLIICGPQGWDTEIKKQHNIHLIGEIPDADLYSLYKHASFFIYPSLYEGFGYPVVEAMSFGCPVAVSNTSSLYEIGANHAVLFNPLSITSIQHALELLMYNKNTQREYAQRGVKCAQYFSENTYIQLFYKAIQKAYDNRN